LTRSVRAVERALDMLICFSRNESVLSLTQIAERVHLSKSTVHRLLATLETKRFITRDKATGLYRLGSRLIEIASLVIRDVDLQRWAQPYLQRLSAECGETVDLSILDGTSMIYLQVIESPQRVKLAVAVGQRLPVFCTASGKAVMAYLPEEQVNEILAEELTRYTGQTQVSTAALREDLKVTRDRGFAISEQEFEKDINAVAAPVLGADNYPVAAIAIVGPYFRLSRERMLNLGPSIRATTDAISREVGLTALSAMVSRPTTPVLVMEPEPKP
jgi:IclR family KDG regulon transcriptional repressor